ncbi:MAG: alpha/beta fold hydrolase [Gemmatimonadaceae bacterium]
MRELWAERDGARLFAADAGSGPAAVMLHGPMATHGAVRGLVDALAPRFRVLAPDLRGNGRSHFHGAITFDGLADDVAALLDAAGEADAIVGGVSGGAAVAVRFALRHPARLRALVLVTPAYGGAALGLLPAQRAAFTELRALAERAPAEGTGVLRPLYERLPEGVQARALAMLETLDPGSVAATARFLDTGAQPFGAAAELRAIRVPALLIPGDDPIHPAEVAAVYAEHLPDCRVEPIAADRAAAVAAFAAEVAGR